MTFDKSGPTKAIEAMAAYLTSKIDVLSVRSYPIVPEMMRHGEAVAGFSYGGCQDAPATQSGMWHEWSLEIVIGPADSGPDAVEGYQIMMAALCSQDHDYSIQRALNSDDIYALENVKGTEWGPMTAGVNQVDQDAHVFGVSLEMRILVEFDSSRYGGYT